MANEVSETTKGTIKLIEYLKNLAAKESAELTKKAAEKSAAKAAKEAELLKKYGEVKGVTPEVKPFDLQTGEILGSGYEEESVKNLLKDLKGSKKEYKEAISGLSEKATSPELKSIQGTSVSGIPEGGIPGGSGMTKEQQLDFLKSRISPKTDESLLTPELPSGSSKIQTTPDLSKLNERTYGQFQPTKELIDPITGEPTKDFMLINRPANLPAVIDPNALNVTKPSPARLSAEVFSKTPDDVLEILRKPKSAEESAEVFKQFEPKPDLNEVNERIYGQFQPTKELIDPSKEIPYPNFVMRENPGAVPAVIKKETIDPYKNFNPTKETIDPNAPSPNFILKDAPSGNFPAIARPEILEAEKLAAMNLPEALAREVKQTPPGPLDNILDFLKQNKGKAAMLGLGGVAGAGLLANTTSNRGAGGQPPDNNKSDVERTKPTGLTAPVDDSSENNENQETSQNRQEEINKELDNLVNKTQQPSAALTEEVPSTYDDVVKNRNFAVLANQLGQAAELIGSSIARTQPVAQDLFKQNIALAERMPEQFKQRTEMAEYDPNSAISKTMRDQLLKVNPNLKLSDNVSAAQILKYLQPTELKEKEIQGKKEKQLSSEEIRKQGLAKRQLESAKNKALAGGGVSATRIRNRINAADNIFGTVGVDTDITEKEIDNLDPEKLNSIPTPMVAELAVEMNAMLSPAGVPPQATFKKLLPNNLAMTTANVKGYITSSLPPAKQKEFVKLVLKTATRIKRNSQKQNADIMKKYFSGTQHIKEQLPEDYDDVLRSLGLNSEDIDSKQKSDEAPTEQATPKTRESASKIEVERRKDVEEYAKEHNLSYERAYTFLKNRGDI